VIAKVAINVKKFSSFCKGNDIPDSGKRFLNLIIEVMLPENETIPKKMEKKINILLNENKLIFSEIGSWMNAIYEVIVTAAPPNPL
jgi:hypothetical protein